MKLTRNNFIAILIGFICSYKISIGGELFIGELIAFFIVFMNLGKLYIPKLIQKMWSLIALWIVVQIISDVVNGTELIKTIKGVGSPAFLMITITACTHYFRKKQNLVPYFFLGTAMGLWFSVVGGEYYLSNPWKWGLGKMTALSILIYFSYWNKKSKLIIVYALMFLFISLLHSSRSLGGMFLIATFTYFFLININRKIKWSKIRAKSSTTYAVILLVFFVVVALNSVFSLLFTSDFVLDHLPEEDALKYRIQASSDLGFLFGARSEMLISVKAFLDKPLLGHGSWPENYDYMYQYINLMDIMGGSQHDYKTAISLVTTGLIPSHSYLMGAMVWGGVLAGFFWLFILYKIIEQIVKNTDKPNLLHIYLSITMLWNILFSPFGANARWATALTLWIIFFTLKNIPTDRNRSIH